MGSRTRHRAIRSTILALALLPSLAGCTIERKYVVDPAVAEQLSQGSPVPTFPALREKDRQPATVQTRSYVAGTARVVGSDTVVTTRQTGKMLAAGIWLTMFGTAISVVGAGLYWGTTGTSKTVGAALAGSGEPFMISGSVLWVLGLNRSPQEAAVALQK